FSVLGGCGLLVYPVLARLENEALSFVWSLVFLFPLLWIALIDIVGHRKKINWAQDEQVNDRSLLLPSVQAALFLALFFAGVSIVKQTMDRASAMSVSEMLTAAAWSIASHLLLFLFAFAALTVVRIAARRFSVPAQAEFALTCGLAIIFGYVVFR